MSLLDDRLFAHGLQVTATSVWAKPLYGKTILAADTTTASRWHLCQWASRFDLAEARPEPLPDGSVRCANPGMSVTWNRKDERLTLAVNGECEYQGRLRKSGEAWPHLLIEQSYKMPIRLEELRDFRLKLGFNVTRSETSPSLALNPGLHTAQLSVYWTVHDIDPEGRSRDMIWLGVPLFDARYDIPPPHHALDVGKDDATLKFIYLIDGHEFWKEPSRHREMASSGSRHQAVPRGCLAQVATGGPHDQRDHGVPRADILQPGLGSPGAVQLFR